MFELTIYSFSEWLKHSHTYSGGADTTEHSVNNYWNTDIHTHTNILRVGTMLGAGDTPENKLTSPHKVPPVAWETRTHGVLWDGDIEAQCGSKTRHSWICSGKDHQSQVTDGYMKQRTGTIWCSDTASNSHHSHLVFLHLWLTQQGRL